MSDDGLIIEYMDLSHIHLAIKRQKGDFIMIQINFQRLSF